MWKIVMNRVAWGALAALCLFSPALALTRVQTDPAVPPRGAIEGTVIDSVTGQPIEGVQVTIIPGQHTTEAGIQSLLQDQKPTVQVLRLSESVPRNGRRAEAVSTMA